MSSSGIDLPDFSKLQLDCLGLVQARVTALDPQIAQLLPKRDIFTTRILLVFLDFLEHFHFQSQHSTVLPLLEPFYIYFLSSVIWSIKRLDQNFRCFCCHGFG